MNKTLRRGLNVNHLGRWMIFIVTFPKFAEENVKQANGVGVKVTTVTPDGCHDERYLHPGGEMGHNVVVLSKGVLRIVNSLPNFILPHETDESIYPDSNFYLWSNQIYTFYIFWDSWVKSSVNK